MKKFKNWINKQIEFIDGDIESFLEDPDYEEHELQKSIAMSIDNIIVDTFNGKCRDNSLKYIIANIIVDEYVDYMYREWYNTKTPQAEFAEEVSDYLTF